MIPVIRILVLIPALVAAGLGGVVIVPRQRTRQLTFFGLINLGIFLWAMAYIIGLSEAAGRSSDAILLQSEIALTVGQLGVAVATTYWLLFSLEIVGDTEWTQGPRMWLLHVPGFALVMAALSNPAHGLFAQYHIEIDSTSFTYGPLAAPLMVMAWALVVTSMVVYARSWMNTTAPVKRRPYALLSFAGALPLFVNIWWIIGGFPVDIVPYNPTILVLVLSDSIVAWAVFRGGLMDVVREAESHAFAAMRDGAMVLGPEGIIRSMNPNARVILPQVLPGDRLDQVAPGLHLEMRRGAEEFEYAIGHHTYWVRFVRMSASRQPGGLGEVLLFTDITERREAEHRIQELNRDLQRTVVELEAATETKNRFVANLSHELRMPLQSIVGYTDVLAGGIAGPVNVEQREHLLIILDSALHLQSLIDSLLDITHGEGSLQLQPEPLDACEMAETLVKSIRPLADGKGLQISSACALSRRTMFTDPTKLRQVLSNLVGNAIKFTAKGSVTVSVESMDDDVVFRVSDTGPGIPAEGLAGIFDAFYQIPTSGADRPPGAGLGLYVCQTLAGYLGGEVTVESTVGVGSVFSLRIPAMLPLYTMPDADRA